MGSTNSQLDECLQELEAGKSIDEVIATRRDLEDSLRPLLELAIELKSSRENVPGPRPEFRSRLRGTIAAWKPGAQS